MKTMSTWLVAMLLLSPVWAQDPATAKPDVGRRLEELQKEQAEITKAWREKMAAAQKAPTPNDGKPVAAVSMRPDFTELRGKFLAAAKDYSGPDQAKLLVPALMISSNREQYTEVLSLLVPTHVKGTALKTMAPMLPNLDMMVGAETAAKVLEQIETGADDPRLLGYAAYARGKKVLATAPADSPEYKAAKERMLAAIEKSGDKALQSTVKGDLAEQETFGLGMVAPDVVGKDLDNVEFKLSDYQGKVVMVDFWGDW